MLAKELGSDLGSTAENDASELVSASPGTTDNLPKEAPATMPEAALETPMPEAADAAPDVAPREDMQVQAEEESDEAGGVEIETEAAAEEATEDVEPYAGEPTEDADDETTAPDPHDERRWYVIHCYSGYENKVKHNLEQRIETMQMQDQIFQVVVPTEDEIEVRDGKRRVVERRIFPGYILVQMKLTDDSWYVVRNTPGVTGFVGMGNVPTPLRPEEVQAITRRMEAEAPKIKVTFKPGQKVRIIDGPFNEFIGVVDEIDMERAKVRVLVSFFGRETPVELDFLQVEKT